MNAQLNTSVERELSTLDAEERERVLAFVRQLKAARVVNTNGKSLLRFAGTIAANDLAAITEAVAAGCEQVSDEW